MIVKLIAPGIIPGDVVTVNHMAGVTQRGDRVLVETRRDGDEYDEELLTVKSVTWPVEVIPSIRNHAVASLPEVLLDRAEDVGDSLCGECGETVDFRRDGIDGPSKWYHTASDRAYCYRDPQDSETAYPERTLTHGR